MLFIFPDTSPVGGSRIDYIFEVIINFVAGIKRKSAQHNYIIYNLHFPDKEFLSIYFSFCLTNYSVNIFLQSIESSNTSCVLFL